MYTKIKTTDGKTLNVTTQQYIVGTYVIINNDPSQQFGINESEEKFHLSIRKKCLKSGDKLVGGSILDYNGKLPINKFEEVE